MPGGVNWGYYCSFLEECGVAGGGPFPGIGQAGDSQRSPPISMESLGTGPQKQEREAGLDKAPRRYGWKMLLWLEDEES